MRERFSDKRDGTEKGSQNVDLLRQRKRERVGLQAKTIDTEGLKHVEWMWVIYQASKDW